jgi:hypothetical protein
VGSKPTSAKPPILYGYRNLYTYMYIFVLIASTSSLQVCGERETSASPRQQNVDGVDKQSQGPGRISRSTASVSGRRSTVSANERLSKRSTRSVARQQVRGVGKQVSVHNVREQTTGPRHRQASGRTVVSVNEQAGPRRKRTRQVHGVSVGK